MRLYEHTRVRVELALRVCEGGALSGCAGRFSGARTSLWASVLPANGEFDAEEREAAPRARLKLLVPADVRVRAGDGIVLEGRAYRVLNVARWAAHLELDCEAAA